MKCYIACWFDANGNRKSGKFELGLSEDDIRFAIEKLGGTVFKIWVTESELLPSTS